MHMQGRGCRDKNRIRRSEEVTVVAGEVTMVHEIGPATEEEVGFLSPTQSCLPATVGYGKDTWPSGGAGPCAPAPQLGYGKSHRYLDGKVST